VPGATPLPLKGIEVGVSDQFGVKKAEKGLEPNAMIRPTPVLY